ncbi:hypothetical protein EMCRGX_G022873 [Ephydatia muelleri]
MNVPGPLVITQSTVSLVKHISPGYGFCLLLIATGGHMLSRMLLVAICFWTLTCTALSKDVVVYKDYSGVQGVIC